MASFQARDIDLRGQASGQGSLAVTVQAWLNARESGGALTG